LVGRVKALTKRIKTNTLSQQISQYTTTASDSENQILNLFSLKSKEKHRFSVSTTIIKRPVGLP
jgi:hypothetical protein